MKASATTNATITTSRIGRSDLKSFFPNRRLEAMKKMQRMRDVIRKGPALPVNLLSHPHSPVGISFPARLFVVLRSVDVIKKMFGAR